MKFKDLEIGQDFRWEADRPLLRKTGNSHFSAAGKGPEAYVRKDARSYSVIPEGEPPSVIAARRDARWYLLADMDARIKIDMDRAGSGTVREIQRQNLLGGLDVLRAEMTTNPENLDQVLHDLIEIVRELV